MTNYNSYYGSCLFRLCSSLRTDIFLRGDSDYQSFKSVTYRKNYCYLIMRGILCLFFYLQFFFYAIHYILPFLVLGISGVHLILLHFRGRRVPGGLRITPGLKIKFVQFFIFKDIVNLIVLWGIVIWILSRPDWSADPVNFIPSDLTSSPIHIQPEWYFLHLYAVLRSIPNKLGGLIGFALAILILSIIRLINSYQSLHQFYIFNFIAWMWLGVNSVLMWLGRQPVEAPYILIGQRLAILYFFIIGWILTFDFLIFFYKKIRRVFLFDLQSN